MTRYTNSHKSFAILLATVTALSACGKKEQPAAPAPVAQQMVQQCGQSMQTGQTECIMVPAGQPNPYAQQVQQPAPQAQSNGIGVGTVAGAAALGAAAGYLAGQNKSTPDYRYNQQPRYEDRRYYEERRVAPVRPAYSAPVARSAPVQNAYVAPKPVVTPMAPVRSVSLQKPAPSTNNNVFKARAAERTATVKPMSIRPSTRPSSRSSRK